MVKTQSIENKLASIKKYLGLLQRYKNISFDEIKNNPDLLGATERYLFLAIQSAIDAAEMLIKFKKLGKPQSMSNVFDLLFEHKLIKQTLHDSLVRMVGFRNILSHGYEYVDYAIVDQILRERLADIDELASIIEQNLAG